MLSLLAVAMVTTLVVLVMSERVAPAPALIITPVVFGLLGGFAPELPEMMLKGVQQLAPTGIMLCFAIFYFCTMSDAGLFDPLIRGIVKFVGRDPVRISIGTAILALVVSLDGDGSTTYIICCTALLPIYRRVGMDPLILACLLMLACGITNILPWGGPTARVASAMAVDPGVVFVPLIVPMLVAAAFVVVLSYFLGRRESLRLQSVSGGSLAASGDPLPPDEVLPVDNNLRRPRLFVFNLILTVALVAGLITGAVPLVLMFMVATTIALMVNYPTLRQQQERLTAHAPNILKVTIVIFGAGVFVGVMNGTGMATALAQSVGHAIPDVLASYLAPITAVLSMPFTFFISHSPFYFGVVPILAEIAAPQGTTSAEMARAALLGEPVHLLSPMIPSTQLLVALAGVDFSKHLAFTLPWAIVLSFILIGTAWLTGAISAG